MATSTSLMSGHECVVLLMAVHTLQVLLPRVLQALLAAAGDYYVLKLASQMYGARAGRYAVSFTLCVQLARSSRTLLECNRGYNRKRKLFVESGYCILLVYTRMYLLGRAFSNGCLSSISTTAPLQLGLLVHLLLLHSNPVKLDGGCTHSSRAVPLDGGLQLPRRTGEEGSKVGKTPVV